MNTIVIDEISSIGESFFSLKIKGSIAKDGILSAFCRLKDRKDTYHIDANDLKKMNDFCIDFFPYEWAKGYQQYGQLTRNQYIGLLKHTIFWYIQEGKMGGFLAAISGYQDLDIEISWDSSSPKTPKKPTFSQVPL